MERVIKKTKDHIICLEYLLKRCDKNSTEVKHLTQTIIENLEFLNFDLMVPQSPESIQLIFDFNMLHTGFDLNAVDANKFQYWQE